MPCLTATNTLYTVRFRRALEEEAKAAWALALLTSRTRSVLKASGRIYADGLLKYEPRDLLDIPLAIPPKIDGAKSRYHEAVDALLDNDVQRSMYIADSWFSN